MNSTDFPIVSFATIAEWELWLEKNHTTSQGIWMRFFKKNSQQQTITYVEAVETALCFGWIDSQVQKYDEISYLQKFTPRRPKSLWSQVNTQRIEKLIELGKMHPSGIKEVEEAKKDGRWEAAYHSPSTATAPKEFLELLKKNKKAFAFYQTLNKTNTYAIIWRIQTAKKPETKQKRIESIIAMLEKGEKFHA